MEGDTNAGDPGEIPEYSAILAKVASSPRNFPIPRKVSRKNLEQAFLTSFELIGGVPRLALWADANPGQFYALASKLFPQQVQAKVGVDESLAAILMKMGSTPEKPVEGSLLSDADGASVAVVHDGQTINVHAHAKEPA